MMSRFATPNLSINTCMRVRYVANGSNLSGVSRGRWFKRRGMCDQNYSETESHKDHLNMLFVGLSREEGGK